MKVIKPEDIAGSAREVHCPRGGFVSLRYLVEGDGMGFSIHRTFIPKGDVQFWHYKNHLEACYCVFGRATLKDVSTGEVFEIVPGTLYALDKHDPHQFQAHEDTVLISVFNPPVKGTEVHKEDGSYEI